MNKLLCLLLAIASPARPQEAHPLSNARGQVATSATGPASKGYADCNPYQPINVQGCFGARGDLRVVGGCSIAAGSTALTCTGAGFVAADAGKAIYISAAGRATKSFASTISGVGSATQITVANAAAASVSAVAAIYATDDTTAIQNAFNYMLTAGVAYAGAGTRALYFPAGGYLHHGLNFTGLEGGLIYGDAFAASDLYAIAVTNPGKVNPGAQTTGVDISDSSANQIMNLSFFGGINVPGFNDLAPAVNLLGGRVRNTGGPNLSVQHSFENVYSETFGAYDLVLYGYEQADFHNSQFQVDSPSAVAALYVSTVNKPQFSSPYVTLVPNQTTTTKINISGARTEFEGYGNMVVFDQGATEGIFTNSIRDAYANITPNSAGQCSLLSDTGSTSYLSALRNIVLDTVYIETTSPNCAVVSVNGPAYQWRVVNVQKYPVANNISQFIFNGGFLDSIAQIDGNAQAPGRHNPLFFATSCIGSNLHLGVQDPTTNCTDYASLDSIASHLPGLASNGSNVRPYRFLNDAGAPKWHKLGEWKGGGAGDTIHITFDSASGASTRGNQQGFVEITAAIADNSAAPNVTGISAWSFGQSSPIANLMIAARAGSTSPANTEWEIWIEAQPHVLGSYRVVVSDNASWSNLPAPGLAPSGPAVVMGTVNSVMNASVPAQSKAR